jgi:mono/diheme cytochrome c family protein
MNRPFFRRIVLVWVVTAVAGGSLGARPQEPAAQRARPAPASPHGQVVSRYCATCHNERTRAGGIAFDSVDITKAAENPELWEKAIRKLRAGMMPPAGAQRPDAATTESLITWLEGELDREAAAHPNPGRPLLHRLNRAEYRNAIRDLLGLEVGDIAALLPPDDSAAGFDNNADVLGISPALLGSYLNAAGEISALAVGDPGTTVGSASFSARQDLSQNIHIEGQPLGTVGGIIAQHVFPLDGEYELRAQLFRQNVGAVRGLEDAREVEFTVDGKRVHLVQIGGPEDLLAEFPEVLPNGNGSVNRAPSAGDKIEERLRVTVPISAGPHTVGVAFLGLSPLVESVQLQPWVRSSSDTYDWTGHPHVDVLTVTGPFKASGPGTTPSRSRIFVCRPARESEEAACATKIIATLARRAYRQPVGETDLQRLVAFYHAGRGEGTFDAGIQAAVQRILASPKFIFRAEAAPAGVAPGAAYRISDFELASRLSFFLWSTIPDDELLKLAGEGKLRRPEVLGQQVRRMLADRKASALVTNFAGQWLQLRNLRTIQPDNDIFPDFDDNLRQAFQREIEMLFDSIMREDRSVVDLLTADYTFVNERLAKHYGIPNVYGSHFRRVTVADEARKGLLGKGGVLMVTSHANRTSPVVRGKWILDNILGTPPPPPPPLVPALAEKSETGQPRTMREQMEQHRANPVCASCHKLMDPLGFALENFDAIGRWRVRDLGKTVDVSSELFDGTKIDGAVDLRRSVLRRSDVFVATMSEKLLTYALGRGLTAQDMPAVRAIRSKAAARDYRFSSLVLGVVESLPFQMTIKAPSEPAPSSQVARQ